MKHNNDKHVLHLIIDGKQFEWHRQDITGAEVRELGNIPTEFEIFLAIKKPWEDELIKDETKVDLARPGIEHFFHKKKDDGLVPIFIKKKEYRVKPGKYQVSEIKKIGEIPIAYILQQLINGKLTPLDANATIDIKGCEEFFAHPPEGKSS